MNANLNHRESMGRDRLAPNKRPRVWAIQLATTIVLALLLGGCPPTLAPGRGFLPACGRNQVKVCVGQCALEVGENATCNVDPCVNNVGNPPVLRVCRQGLTCRPNGLRPNEGSCTTIANPPPNRETPMVCDPGAALGSDANQCIHNPGMFCKGLQCPFQPNNLPAGALGSCAFPLGEGSTGCDGDWGSVLNPRQGTPVCSPCGPGLRCFQNTCRRRCDAEVGGINACRPPSAPYLMDGGVSRTDMYDYRCELVSENQSSAQSGVFALCTRAAPHLAMCPIARSFETRSVALQPFSVNVIAPCPGPDVLCLASEHVTRFTYLNTPLNGPPQNGGGLAPTSPCMDNCDSCQSSEIYPQNVGSGPMPGLCCRPLGSLCSVDSDCCSNGAPGALCINSVCLQGCSPRLQPPTENVDPAFVCPFTAECRTINRPGGFVVSACVPCGQLGDECCTNGGLRPECGAALREPYVSVAGIYAFGDLSCQDVPANFASQQGSSRRCLRPGGFSANATPTPNCGGIGQVCCPPTRRTQGAGGNDAIDIIPQGGRCLTLPRADQRLVNLEGPTTRAVCVNETCVPCGTLGGPCCDLALSQINDRTAMPARGSVAAGQPPICLETRHNTSLIPRRTCLDLTGPFAPSRCGTATVCNSGASPASVTPGTCVHCGDEGEPCCAAQSCSSQALACGPQGICSRCGGQGQPCCDCRDPLCDDPRAQCISGLCARGDG